MQLATTSKGGITQPQGKSTAIFDAYTRLQLSVADAEQIDQKSAEFNSKLDKAQSQWDRVINQLEADVKKALEARRRNEQRVADIMELLT